MTQDELRMLREMRMFAALPKKLQVGIELMEWRLRHGTKWRWVG